MNNNYTQILEDRLWQIAGEWEETEDYSVAIMFLNDKNSFRSFGEGLLAIIQKKYPAENISLENVIAFILKCCTKNGVNLSDIASSNTLTNWFKKDMRPKKGETSRQSMFALAFALELSLVETKELFYKVYLDRAFNYRSEEEVIYYYCIKNRRSWSDAKKLIHRATSQDSKSLDHTEHTVLIKTSVEAMINDDDLLDYISEHGHNFEKNSVRATEEFQKLLSQAKMKVKAEIELPENDGIYIGKWKHGGSVSNNLLFEVITGAKITGNKGTKTVFNNAFLPKEIKNRFPEAITFSKKELTSEERRKAIILLFSYVIWYEVQWNSNNTEYDFDDYIAQIDDLMFECNYPQMYFGNPYDWLFLYCAQSERPLDVFRDILQDVLEIVE